MMYFVVLFASPLYFLIRGKIGGFILNSLFYGAALILLVSFVGAFLAPLPWFIGVGHAMWHLRKEMMEEATTLMAQKMAQAMRNPENTL
jgi:hypothetical protein